MKTRLLLAVALLMAVSGFAQLSQSDVIQAREKSKAEVLKVYPDAGDETTALGKEVARIIKVLTDTKDPILYRLDAPKVVVEMAARNLGVAPKSQAPTLQPGQLVVAIADERRVPTNGVYRWDVEKGEIYEFRGTTKEGLIVLLVGKRIINAHAGNFASVPVDDLTRAATVYLEEIRKSEAVDRKSQIVESPQIQEQDPVTPNAYGLGVNADLYGRQHTYRQPNGEQLSPVLQDSVTRDAYGLGAHMDTFGRKVYDSEP